MKNKLSQNLESIGTVMWLVMDFIWMCGYDIVAIIISVPTVWLLIGACLNYKGEKKSELHALSASVFWFIMNTCWIAGELIKAHEFQYLWCAKISFLIACIFVYLSFKYSKKEKEPIDFKRLKIK